MTSEIKRILSFPSYETNFSLIFLSSQPSIIPRILRPALLLILKEESISSCSAGIKITNNIEIKKLNQKYLNKNYPTDVLSFSDEEDPNYLGDMVISLEKANQQAQERNISWEKELQRLLIHAMLHLVGYNHENTSQAKAKKMMARQKALVSKLPALY